MTRQSDTVTITDDFGNAKLYRKFSARLDDFRHDYPLNQGYLVKLTNKIVTPGLDDLIPLYTMAIQAGLNPQDMGLPALPTRRVVVMEASLVDSQGRVLETASAVGDMNTQKGWECTETAARQRLIAALGYGGDVFDDDEATVINSITNAKSTSTTPAARGIKGAASNIRPLGAATQAKPASVQQTNQSEQASQSPQRDLVEQSTGEGGDNSKPDQEIPENSNSQLKTQVTSASEESSGTKQSESNTGASEEIPSAVMNRLINVCKKKGVEVPDVKTLQEAKEKTKEISRL